MRALVLAALVGIACVAGPVDEAKAPPNHITLVIENGYTGTAIVTLYLLHRGSSHKQIITSLISHRYVMRIPTIRALEDDQFYLEGAFLEPWYSENLFYLRPGDCVRLVVGVKPIYSYLMMCEDEP